MAEDAAEFGRLKSLPSTFTQPIYVNTQGKLSPFKIKRPVLKIAQLNKVARRQRCAVKTGNAEQWMLKQKTN